ncbi:hypothetical protein M4L90_14655 [Staphylococcus equorum]|uniref:Uncharacterized protein n=1 Tax=Staphylococcus equorum TaxID=246432 RepID=A0A9X4L7P7_9STAP|nr:hypothetical protein [Staphylococcus equorum]MDG0841770.1 hypothetical protein [Staphylococcus equorum]MDG0847486.1 hypothetical protein [Staphylococcus equorum]PTE82338.1 hypothetical protein BUY85_00950 [Staphylococcus equorum]
MTTVNRNHQDLESSSKLNDIEKFETFDINSFLEHKRLAVEKVIVDSHIKLEARIVEDNTRYKDEDNANVNVDKVITFIIHENIANQINIVNIIGREIEVKELSNDDAFLYGINSLKVMVKNIDIKEDKIEGFKQRSKFTKADYRLVKMNQFKTFDYNKFLSSYDMDILTIYPQSPTTARVIIIITDDYNEDENISNVGKTFSIKIEMPKVRDIPLALLIDNKRFTIDNLYGHITGMIVKNNQVLLTADALIVESDNQTFTVGDADESNTSKDVSNNANIDTNNNISNYMNNNLNN